MRRKIKSWRRYLALIKIIFWREFNSMYRRTVLGPFWALIAPAAYVTVFIFFRLLFGLKDVEGVPVIPFLFSGLCLWLFFSNTVNAAFPSITRNIKILKKMPIPALVFIFSGTLLPIFTCFVHLALLECLLLFFGYYPSIHYIAIPAIMLLVAGFAVGVGILVATIAVYRQDIIQILPTIIQLGMFATPIFFSADIVPEKLRWVVNYNPMAQCIGMFRNVIFQSSWPSVDVLIKTFLVVVVLWGIALPFFQRTSRYLADQF